MTTGSGAAPEGVRHDRVHDMSQLREDVPDQAVAAKWAKISPLIDRLVERAGDEADFEHRRDSALTGDDRATSPYNTSHAFRQSLTAAIDHLHAAKTLVHDVGMVHLGAPATLARSALENAATGWWLLEPRGRDERVLRTLRWYSRNFRDQHTALDDTTLIPERTLEQKLGKVRAIAAKRGLNPDQAAGGYKMSTVIEAHTAGTRTDSKFGWQLASGFAHGRPWAYLGALSQDRRPSDEDGIMKVRLTNTVQLGLWPTLTALHAVEDTLRLWEQRAGHHRT